MMVSLPDEDVPQELDENDGPRPPGSSGRADDTGTLAPNDPNNSGSDPNIINK